MPSKSIKPGEIFLMDGKPFSYTVGEKGIILKTGKEKKPFIAPSLIEVQKYFTDKGYSGFEDFYRNYSEAEPKWTDRNGSPVKNWQAKARQVWFTEKRKIVQVKENDPMKGMIM